MHREAVTTLLDRLGVDLANILPDRQYLLFGGSGERPAGGVRDIVQTFTSEDEARAAFLDLRLTVRDRQGWGELISLDVRGRVRRLCWFEHRATLSGVHWR